MNTTSHTLLAVHGTTALAILAIAGVAHAGPAPTAHPVVRTVAPAKPLPAATKGAQPGASTSPVAAATPPPGSTPSTPSAPAAGPGGPPPVTTLRIAGPAKVRVGEPTRWQALGAPGPSQAQALYSWDFAGDGRYGPAAPTPSVRHKFTRPGTFQIGVLALDPQGRRTTGHLRVVVLAATPATTHRPAHTHVTLSQPKRAPLARAAAGASVSIKDFSFGPSAITIHAGDTVTWVNEGPSNHTATAPGVFNTGVLHPGQSASQTFTHAGTFSYRCSIHPFMRAAVTVLPAPGSAGTAPGSGSEAAGNSAFAPSSTTRSAIPSTPGRALPATGLDTRSEMGAGLAMLVLGSSLLIGTARGRRARARRRGD